MTRILILVLSILLFLILDILIANKMQEIAVLKGHGKSYWLWCFFLMPIGILMVIALPDNRVYYSLQYICSKLENGEESVEDNSDTEKNSKKNK